MTDLRDARLAQALQHAPDSDAQPREATRDAIKNIAARAIHPGARASNHHQPSWWQRCWYSMAQIRGPWGGALATVVLGGIITLMWYEQELPTPALPPTAPEMATEVPAPAAAPAPTSASEADSTPQHALAPLSTLGKTAAPPPEAAREAAAPTESLAMRKSSSDMAHPPTTEGAMEGRSSTTPLAPSPVVAQGAAQEKASGPSPVLAEQDPAHAKIASAAKVTSPVTTAEASADTASDRAVPIASAAPAAPSAEASPRARQSGAPSVLRGLTASEATPSASAMLPASLRYQGRSYALSPTQIAQWQQLLTQSTEHAVVDAPGHSVATTSGAQAELRLVLPSQTGGQGDGGDVFELSGLRFVWKRAGQAPVTGSLRAQDRAVLLRTAQALSAQP